MADGSGAFWNTERGSSTNSSKQVTQRVFDQQAIDKLIYDALSADGGIANLVGMQGQSGGYDASSARLMSQDFMAKVIGELAVLSSPEVVTGQKKEVNKKSSAGAGLKTVICTELVRQGLLDPELYERGTDHFVCLPKEIVNGYHVWAIKIVPLMQKYPLLAKALLPIARGRYEMIVNKKTNFWGFVTIYIGQPICYLIGAVIGGEDVRLARNS